MDDLSDKINSLLSDPKSMEKIKNLASMFSSSNGSDNNGNDHGTGNGSEEPPKENHNKTGDLQIDPEMLFKVKKALDVMKKDDPRIDLLLALRPNMSEMRQHKIDEAIHILRLLSLMPLLREQGFLNI